MLQAEILSYIAARETVQKSMQMTSSITGPYRTPLSNRHTISSYVIALNTPEST